MEQIRQTPLPGVGICYEYETSAGRRIGVVVRSSGRRELVVYAEHDPDAVAESVDLGIDEATIVAEVLAGQEIADAPGSMDAIIGGVAVDWLTVPDSFAAATIGSLAVRAKTGANIVAVVTDDVVDPSPGPDRLIQSRDRVVVVGIPESIEGVMALFDA